MSPAPLPAARARWACPPRWIAREPGADSPLWAWPLAAAELQAFAATALPGRRRALHLLCDAGPRHVQAVTDALLGAAGERPVRCAWRPSSPRLRGKDEPGLLEQSHGGFVVVPTPSLAELPGSWAALREALVLGEVARHEARDPKTPSASHRARISLVLVGPDGPLKSLRDKDPRLNALLDRRVPLDSDLPRDRQGVATLSARLRLEARDTEPISAAALAALVEEATGHGVRRERLSNDTSGAVDTLSEARARHPRGRLTAPQVRAALTERRRRLGGPEQKHRDRVTNRQLLVHTSGHEQGVVNGLMVYGASLHPYAIPGRITARVAVGRQGIINVEREAKYSGRSYDKGVFLLTAWLRGLFARTSPLGVVASLAFEQNYGKVDGDSATLAEAAALFSELSELPARQDMAVTGAVTQRGDVLPVGSVNLKVQGWWRSCRDRDPDAVVGVILPAVNVPDLQLGPLLVAAMERGELLLYPVERVSEALELLLERPWSAEGEDARQAILPRAAARMRRMSERLHPPRPQRGKAANKKQPSR